MSKGSAVAFTDEEVAQLVSVVTEIGPRQWQLVAKECAFADKAKTAAVLKRKFEELEGAAESGLRSRRAERAAVAPSLRDDGADAADAGAASAAAAVARSKIVKPCEMAPCLLAGTNRSKARGLVLFSCSMCSKTFHSKCAGYSVQLSKEDDKLGLCNRCRERVGIAAASVESGLDELAFVRPALEAAGFEIVDVIGDGWCVFRAVVQALRHLGTAIGDPELETQLVAVLQVSVPEPPEPPPPPKPKKKKKKAAAAAAAAADVAAEPDAAREAPQEPVPEEEPLDLLLQALVRYVMYTLGQDGALSAAERRTAMELYKRPPRTLRSRFNSDLFDRVPGCVSRVLRESFEIKLVVSYVAGFERAVHTGELTREGDLVPAYDELPPPRHAHLLKTGVYTGYEHYSTLRRIRPQEDV